MHLLQSAFKRAIAVYILRLESLSGLDMFYYSFLLYAFWVKSRAGGHHHGKTATARRNVHGEEYIIFYFLPSPKSGLLFVLFVFGHADQTHHHHTPLA